MAPMFSTQDGVREAILGKAYPELLYGSDPDIERYFSLRARGNSVEALRLYNLRLKAKYPEENRRVLLLSHFRTKDPRYGSLLRQSALELAASMIERIKRNIRYLTLPMENVPESDPYRLLKAVEQVARFLPADRFDATAALDNYRRYAELLNFKKELMSFTAELGKEYLLESQSEGDDERVDFMERSRQMERRKREHRTKRHFDLSKISFDPADIARIVLPSNITRKEDKVIGYCYRYWDLVNDPGFERVVLLYSRKYRTFHYDVYRTIKIGRASKFTDDEILNRVSTALSSSYSYSVQGDIYMLSMWRRLRGGLAPAHYAVQAAESVQKTQGAVKADAPSKEASPRNEERTKTRTTKRGKAAAKAALSAPKEAPKVEKKSRAPRPADPAEKKTPRLKAAAAKKKPRPKEAPRERSRSTATESVSDIIRRVSGRSYDVYHDIFLSSVRASIRSVLVASQSRSHGIFDASLNAAEEAVHGFMAANYENPYMDWAGSKERERVAALGYSLPSLLPVIEDCVKKL
jgi:hypothetical protein